MKHQEKDWLPVVIVAGLVAGIAFLWSRSANAGVGIPLERLGLDPVAERAARLLQQQHPDVIFLSGRRTLAEQADAMASNVMADRVWIAKTYVQSNAASALQKWVDAHPQARTRSAIASGLLSVMEPMPADVVGRISLHLVGLAFDIRPVKGRRAESVKTAIRRLPGLSKFIDHEGALIRWHAQFGAPS